MTFSQIIPPGLASIANGRDALPTNEAATVLNRKDQTMRKWACLENGPIRPIRINGRLAWRVVDLAKLLNGGQ
ncbi:DNA-binding protein [Ralstonia solanacearum]|uniref:DNA-binding protein n=1 Tax=Ralstonia solanacearum TaxID=305 RepID=UPI003514E1C2